MAADIIEIKGQRQISNILRKEVEELQRKLRNAQAKIRRLEKMVLPPILPAIRRPKCKPPRYRNRRPIPNSPR
jgi:hypothetical protein